MNENQRKWLLDLQSRGVRFETLLVANDEWIDGLQKLGFRGDKEAYRIPVQSIPDIPDWRELCREMQSKGVEFEYFTGSKNGWSARGKVMFHDPHGRSEYRIPQQPIPLWKEPEMTEEAKQEIPHRELQIQWHEDWIHALKTGEEMREWEYRLANSEKDWVTLLPYEIPDVGACEYRRKPRTVTYWHCVASGIIDDDDGRDDVVLWSTSSRDDMEREINIMKETDSAARFGPITETTVELED